MWKKLLIAVLALIMLLLPIALRWLHFYEGRYEPAKVRRPDLTGIEPPAPEIASFADHYATYPDGTILVDLAHDNRFEMADLDVLQTRLTARGQQIETIGSTEEMAEQLRYAKALIVISPGKDWTPDEIELAQEFVDKGGRLLLVTDPTHYGVVFDDEDLPVLDEDAPHINTLASRFGLLFQTDYLYNTTDNAGNFRNIKLSEFAEHSLTDELDQVVFYAVHSIDSEEPALIATSGETRSSNSERTDPLAVAVLAADDAVLALGDLTFMTEPFNAASDNDRLTASIADYLSGVERQYELADFPFFFDPEVDLVYPGTPLLDSSLLKGGGALQALFAEKGKELTVQDTEDETSDTLFFGLYQEADEIEPYLAAANVTLLITATDTISSDQEPIGETEPKLKPTTAALTSPQTSPTTSALEITAPSLSRPGAGAEITATATISPTLKQLIRIESLGEMVVTGTMLLLLQGDGERQVMIVLADSEKALGSAVQRLTKGDLSACLLHDTGVPYPTSLALCPTGEVTTGADGGGWQKPTAVPPTPTATPTVTKTVEPTEVPEESGARILIIALDKGEGRYEGRTGADTYTSILKENYDVTLRSRARHGLPDESEFSGYDLVIWTAGDFEKALDEEGSDLVLLGMLKGIPSVMSGAYINDANSQSVQRDIQVEDVTHPLAKGFKQGEVIGFVTEPLDNDYEVDLQDDPGLEAKVVFVRGPDSEDSGTASIYVFEDTMASVRVAFIGVPIYLLPEEVGARLAVNAVSWMLDTR